MMRKRKFNEIIAVQINQNDIIFILLEQFNEENLWFQVESIAVSQK